MWDTDEMHGCFAENQSVDSTHLHLTWACVGQHNAELRKMGALLCTRQLPRSMAPQPKSRCDNDSARRWELHQDGDYKTHNTGLIRWFQNELDSTDAAKRFGQRSSQWPSFVNWICTHEMWRTRLGGTDQKPPFEIWSVDSERDSIGCWRKRVIRWINWKQYIKENTKMHGTFGYQNKFKTKTSVPIITSVL